MPPRTVMPAIESSDDAREAAREEGVEEMDDAESVDG